MRRYCENWLSEKLIGTTNARLRRAAAASGGFGAGWPGRPSPSNLTHRARRIPACQIRIHERLTCRQFSSLQNFSFISMSYKKISFRKQRQGGTHHHRAHGVFTVAQARDDAKEHLRNMKKGIAPRDVARNEQPRWYRCAAWPMRICATAS